MNINLRKWVPIALCCLPGIAIVAIVGIGILLGGAAFGAFIGTPLGLGLIALALLACPISMILMMRRQMNRDDAASDSPGMADCCLPEEPQAVSEIDSQADRLATLRAQREALERELAEMQAR